jgi:hypothetical protein
MARSENDKGIRVNVRLCDQDGNPLQVPGLVAIPSDRLACFEKIPDLVRKFVAAVNGPADPLRTKYLKNLCALEAELDRLAQLWDEPNVTAEN